VKNLLAVKGEKILTITNGVLEDSAILIDNGKIKDVGPNLQIPKDVKVLKSKVVMPGLVE
jgi:imidazolonepropionase-like amidohydrolase